MPRTCMRAFIGHDGPVGCLQFDACKVLTGSSDENVKVDATSIPCAIALTGCAGCHAGMGPGLWQMLEHFASAECCSMPPLC